MKTKEEVEPLSTKDVHEKIKDELKELRKFKTNFEDNLKIAIGRTNKLNDLLERTEKDRLRLLEENKLLESKIDRQNVIEKYIQEEAKKIIKKCQDAQDKQVEELKKEISPYAFTEQGLQHIHKSIEKIFKEKKEYDGKSK